MCCRLGYFLFQRCLHTREELSVSAVQEYAIGSTTQKQKPSGLKFTGPPFNYLFHRYIISIEQYITQ